MNTNTLWTLLGVDDTGYHRQMREAGNAVGRYESVANARLRRVEGHFASLERNVSSSLNRVKQATIGVIGGASIKNMMDYADSYNVLVAKLKNAIGAGEDFAVTQRALIGMANANRQEIGATTQLYISLSQSMTEAQQAQFDMLNMTNSLSQALVVSGTKSEYAGELIRQLGQAIASDFKGVGQEINSLLDQAPYLANVLAKELGLKSAGQLKKFAADGELSTQKFAEALGRAAKKIETDFSRMPLTVAQSMTQLDNTMLTYFGRSDLVQSGTSSIAAAISGLAENFDVAAKGAALLAGVIAGKLAQSMATATISYIANYRAAQLAIKYSLTLSAAYNGISVSALKAASSTTLLSRAMALIASNPVGIAITALTTAYVFLGDEIDNVEVLQQQLHQEMLGYPEISDKLISKNKEIAQSARESVQQQISDTIRLMQAQQTLLDKRLGIGTTPDNFIAKTDQGVKAVLQTMAGWTPFYDGPEEIGAEIDIYQEKVKKLRTLLENPQEYSLEKPIKETETASGNVAAALDEQAKKTNTLRDAQMQLNERLQEMVTAQERDNFTLGMEDGRRAVAELQFQLEDMAKAVGGFNKHQQAMADLLVKNAAYLQKKKEKQQADTEATKEAERAAEAYAESMRRPIENAMENVQDTITDTMAGVFDGSVNSAKDAADSIKRIFIRMAAELATLQLFGKDGLNISGIISGVGGGKASAITAGSSGGGSVIGGALREGSSLLGATKIGWAINAFGASALPSVFGTGAPLASGIGATQAGLLGGAGIGLSTIALPVAGLAIGVIASKLFAGKEKAVASNFGGTVGAGGDLAGLVIRTNGKGDPAVAQGMSEGVNTIAKALIAAGVNVAGQTVQGGVDAGRGFIGLGAGDYQNKISTGIRFNPNGGEAALNEAMATLAIAMTRASDQGNNLASVLDNIKTSGNNADAVLSDIAFALNFDSLGELPKDITEVETVIATLRQEFAAAANTAQRLGLEVEKVQRAETKRIATLRQSETSTIAMQILEMTAPSEAEAAKERNRFALQMRNLQAMQATAEDFQLAQVLHQLTLKNIYEGNNQLQTQVAEAEKTRLEETQNAFQQFTTIANNFRGLVDSFQLGQYSPYDPASRLSLMRAEVQSLGNKAAGGDAQAANDLQSLIPAFLELSGEVNGFNASFESDRAMAESVARQTYDTALRQASLQQQLIIQAQQQTTVLQQGFAGLQSALTGLGSSLSASSIAGAAGATLTSAQSWATQWGRVRGKLVGNETATNGLLSSRLAGDSALMAQFESDKRLAGFNEGGLIRGKSGIDQNAIRISDGEFVMRRSAVEAISVPALSNMNSTGRIPIDFSGLEQSIGRVEAGIKGLQKIMATAEEIVIVQLQHIAGEVSGLGKKARMLEAGR